MYPILQHTHPFHSFYVKNVFSISTKTHLTRCVPSTDIETVWKIRKINIEVIRIVFKLFYSYFKTHKIHKKYFDSHFKNIFLYKNFIFTKNNETLSMVSHNQNTIYRKVISLVLFF